MSRGIPQFNLQKLMVGWPKIAESHKNALGEGRGIGEELARLHASALQQISRNAGQDPTKSDKAIIRLGCHGFNLYVSALSLITRGLFDVASHLMRGLFDCQALVYATGSSEDLAKRFGDGSLAASDARKILIEILNAAGEAETAERFERKYKEEREASNSLAHVSMIHAEKVLEVTGDAATPMLLGRFDEAECRNFWLISLEQEFWTVTWFYALRRPLFHDEGIAQWEAMRRSFTKWYKAEAEKLGIPKIPEQAEETKR